MLEPGGLVKGTTLFPESQDPGSEQGPDGEPRKKIPKKDERTWIQKNWIFLIPAGMLVCSAPCSVQLLSLQTNGEQCNRHMDRHTLVSTSTIITYHLGMVWLTGAFLDLLACLRAWGNMCHTHNWHDCYIVVA